MRVRRCGVVYTSVHRRTKRTIILTLAEPNRNGIRAMDGNGENDTSIEIMAGETYDLITRRVVLMREG